MKTTVRGRTLAERLAKVPFVKTGDSPRDRIDDEIRLMLRKGDDRSDTFNLLYFVSRFLANKGSSGYEYTRGVEKADLTPPELAQHILERM